MWKNCLLASILVWGAATPVYSNTKSVLPEPTAAQCPNPDVAHPQGFTQYCQTATDLPPFPCVAGVPNTFVWSPVEDGNTTFSNRKTYEVTAQLGRWCN